MKINKAFLIWVPVLIIGSAYLGYRWSDRPRPESRQAETSPSHGAVSHRPSGSPPQLASDSGQAPDQVPAQDSLFPDTLLGKALNRHIRRMHTRGADANRNYRESIVGLRKDASEVAKLLYETYQKLDEGRYQVRWDITETLRELKTPAAFPALLSIASSPVPPERSRDIHLHSTRSEEIAIRVTAVQGLAHLAEIGNQAAEAALVGFIQTPDLGIRRMAIRGYLAAGPDLEQRVLKIKKQLPQSQHHLVTLDSSDISKVPQPPKEEFSRSPASAGAPAAKDVIPEIKALNRIFSAEDE